MVFILNIVPRFIVFVYAAWASLRFFELTSETLELILNGVALIFVVEINEIVYYSVATANTRDTLDSIKIYFGRQPNWLNKSLKCGACEFLSILLYLVYGVL